jgi:hypothetical protein
MDGGWINGIRPKSTIRGRGFDVAGPARSEQNASIMSRPVRALSIALALAGASALAIAVEVGRWWSEGDISIGPVSGWRCFGGAPCSRTDLGWVGGSDTWVRFGTATYAAGLVAAATLVILAAALASKRTGRLAARVVVAATLTAVVAGSVFIGAFPGLAGMHVDHGVWLYGGGVALAAVAAAVVLRAARRAEVAA